MATTEDEKSAGQSGAVRFGWSVYQQVAAVFATFALAAFLRHFFDIGWRGWAEDFVGYWDAYVRPAVKWFFDTTLSTPLRWAFGWHVEVPLVLRDYFAVGVAMGTSMTRSQRAYGTGRREMGFDGTAPLLTEASGESYLSSLATNVAMAVLLWPVLLLLYLLIMALALFTLVLSLGPGEQNREDRKGSFVELGWNVRTLSPLVYLSLLIAVNYFVLTRR